MSMMSGWTRLAIVLSVAWLLAVTAYAGFDYWRMSSQEAGWENGPWLAYREKAADPLGLFPNPAMKVDFVPDVNSLFTGCGLRTGDSKTSCWFRIERFIGFALIPLVLAWLIAVLSFVAIRWVRAGFHRRT